MRNKLLIQFIFAFLGIFSFKIITGQTLVMNEVSQGESGNQEYIELIVIDTTAVYDCASGEPPCIDIRGWIIDDNSGYHGPAGVASGACRFSNDPLWSCVPLGTIIVIYNGGDPNNELPTLLDNTMTDGNCQIIAPIDDVNLFETNATTPGAVACSYPTTGWTPGGNWSNVVMANGGDCFRIVDLAGCEVFSLCWDDNTTDATVYFGGGATSGSSATNTVYFFNGTDPTDVANWTVGCADQPACGVQEQTPGSPNNAANAAYIAQFNNNCTPIPPLDASATGVDGCGCTGTASASATGSIPGYTYEWYDDSFVSIGQSTANATGLCAGTYNVIVTSSIDCEDTVQVTINSTGSDDPGTNGALDTCAALTGNVNLFDYLGGTPDNTGTWSGPSGTSGAQMGTINLATASAGTYTYTVGTVPCTASADVVLSFTALPVVTATGTNITCNGLTDGTVDASSTGSNPFTYSWDNGLGAGASHSGLGANTYIVTVTDANGCTDTDNVTISEPTAITPSIAPVEVSCNGDCDGQATVNVSGGSGSFDFLWDNATTDNTATTQANLCATTYNVTVSETANAACSETASITVTEPSVISLSETNTPANCGAADGTATITASGGSGTYTDYNWSPAPGGGQGTASATGLATGSYTVTVTDDNNCTASINVNISNSAAPTISEVVASHVDVSCNGLSDGEAEVSVSGGTAPLTIAWAPSGGSTATATGLAAGTYTVTVTDANTCSSSTTIDITEPAALTISSSGSDEHCSQNDGTVTTTVTGGTISYTYNWYTDSGLTTLAGMGSNLSNLAAGEYFIEATDGNGCSILDSVTISNLVGPSVSAIVNADATDAITCDGDATASVMGGTGTIDFLWDNGNTAANATDLCVGNNCVTVTDDFGCTDVACVTIPNSAGITLSLVGVDPTCNDLCDGTIDATVTNATAPVTYAWAHGPTTEDLTGLCAGSYELTVADGLGETATATVVLNNPDAISIQTNTFSQVSCNGICDGEIMITPTGGTGTLNVTWTDATPTTIGTSNTVSSLCAGSYDLNIIDVNGCSFDSTYVITEPTALSVTTSASNSNCSAADGGVSVIVSGGTILVDYSYSWTDAGLATIGTTNAVNSLFAGMYYVTITDDNGCSLLDSAQVIDVIPSITIVEDSSAVTCLGDSDGAVDLTITSPNGYSVNWIGPGGFSAASTDNISSLEAGTYNYTYTDLNGCSTSGSVIVDTPTELILNLVVDSTSCDVACDGSIAASATGGVGPYTFSSNFPGWTNGTADLCIGNYQITVTDFNGCIVSVDTIVDHDDNRPDPTITLTDLDYCIDEGSFAITTAETGGSWSTSGSGIVDPVNGIFSPADAGVGTEEIIYTFSGVCGDADTIDITIHQLEDASFTVASNLCVDEAATALNPTNAGGIWQGTGVNGATLTFDPAGAGAGTHDVTYIIAGQCPDTVVQQVTVLELQDPIISVIPSLCIDSGNVQLTVSIPGGVWSGVSNASGVINTTALGSGTFEAIYTIQSQCGGSDTLDITINDLPVIDISVSDTLGCAPMTVNFSDLNALAGNSYNWYLEGIEVSTNNADNFTFTQDGCEELSVSVTDANGCSNTATYPTLICTEPFPIALFEYNPANPTTYDYLVDVTNLSSDAGGYTWTMDGSPISTDTDLNLNFSDNEPGNFYLCLTAMNDLGCADTYCDTITLEDEFAIYVPNTFTPDGNGRNETFGPVYSGEQPEEISFMIFNRWGQLIYEVETFDEFWDGTYFGQPAQEDVYVWKIKYKMPNSTQRETLIGHVNLIR